jgi:hypothetical protein
MSDPKVQALATTFLEHPHGVKTLVSTALKAMEVDIKKNPKAYYKASRQVFKALIAAAAQHILEDGGNRQLLADTYSPEDAWTLYLARHPELAAKLAAQEPKPPPKPNSLFKLIPGGKPPEAMSPAELAASLDEDEEALVNSSGCGCACHFEHDAWEPTGHDCCTNESKGG